MISYPLSFGPTFFTLLRNSSLQRHMNTLYMHSFPFNNSSKQFSNQKILSYSVNFPSLSASSWLKSLCVWEKFGILYMYSYINVCFTQVDTNSPVSLSRRSLCARRRRVSRRGRVFQTCLYRSARRSSWGRRRWPSGLCSAARGSSHVCTSTSSSGKALYSKKVNCIFDWEYSKFHECLQNRSTRRSFWGLRRLL